jgi:transposase-like protein
MGAVQRGGKVVAVHVDSANAENAANLAWTHVLPSSMIFSDEARIYEQFDGSVHYTHDRVKHSASVYVSGDVHTQTIEGFWSLVKRGIHGVYHSVSSKWLQSYLDEYSWRYNHREHTIRRPGERRVPIGEAKFRLLVDRACVLPLAPKP